MDDAQKKRLEELRILREKREVREQDEADQRELQEEELCAQLEEKGQRRGRDFEVVNNIFGVFGVRKPDTQAIMNLDKAPQEKLLSQQWNIDLLKHYILPDEKRGLEFAAVAIDRPGLLWEVRDAFNGLGGSRRVHLQKK